MRTLAYLTLDCAFLALVAGAMILCYVLLSGI
jgi:hypothetical protein